ncbi:hypothetical protein F5Y09DRAFT_345352 [Xylaria sp. FL1042]|nr:hypothetical protein F5Y09DRAFT_345352 [Xylaria sp. FL1042]
MPISGPIGGVGATGDDDNIKTIDNKDGRAATPQNDREQIILDAISARIAALEALVADDEYEDIVSSLGDHDDLEDGEPPLESLSEELLNDSSATGAGRQTADRLFARIQPGDCEDVFEDSAAPKDGEYPPELPVELLDEDDFKRLNPRIFSQGSPFPFAEIANGSIGTVFLGVQPVHIHPQVYFRSDMLQEMFINGSEHGVLPDVGLQEFKIVMLAIYGINCPILGHATYKGVDYINALGLCIKLRCDGSVYESVVQCMRGYFSAFQEWVTIPRNAMTQDLHRTKLLEINDCFKAYKKYVCDGRPAPFPVNCFAILLAQLCPDNVYNWYSDVLDAELVCQVSMALMRQRGNIMPFTVEEEELFTRPRL